MNRYFRWVMVGIAFLQLIFGFGFALLVPWMTSLWPFSYAGNMSFRLIGSILVAAAASTLWCIWEREDGALSGVGLDYVAILLPVGIFALQAAAGDREQVILGIACLLGALFGAFLFLYSVRIPITPRPALPRLVRISFVVFIVALALVGGRLVLGATDVLPWSLTYTGAVIYGWMFLGAAVYFAYTLVRPSWHNAGGQLAGFLAYDLVLILPFLQRLPTIDPQYALSQVLYLLVVVLSSALAVYYLFINRETRVSRTGPQAVEHASALAGATEITRQ